jgi:hypothetical protein
VPNHIHPPLGSVTIFGVTISWGCDWLLGHDPGCAPLPPEAACNEILNGKNKGNYLRQHPRALALAVAACEAGNNFSEQDTPVLIKNPLNPT